MAVPDYLQDFVTDFAQQAKTSFSAPLDPKTFMGPQFVAGLDPLQTQAIGIAQQGVGSFAPFLSSAQQAITQAGQDVAGLQQFAGTGAGTGAGSIAAFQSPFQQQVIDESLRQFDLSRQGGLQQIADQAVAQGALLKILSVNVGFGAVPTANDLNMGIVDLGNPAYNTVIFSANPGTLGVTNISYIPDGEVIIAASQEFHVTFTNAASTQYGVTITYEIIN